MIQQQIRLCAERPQAYPSIPRVWARECGGFTHPHPVLDCSQPEALVTYDSDITKISLYVHLTSSNGDISDRSFALAYLVIGTDNGSTR